MVVEAEATVAPGAIADAIAGFRGAAAATVLLLPTLRTAPLLTVLMTMLLASDADEVARPFDSTAEGAAGVCVCGKENARKWERMNNALGCV